MKKLIEEILESEQVLNLRDQSNIRYITGLIMEAIQSEGWYLNIGTHRSTTKPLSSSQRIAEFDPDGIEYSEFAHLSTDRPDEVKYDGDGKELEVKIRTKRVKSYGFFKNKYYDD